LRKNKLYSSLFSLILFLYAGSTLANPEKEVGPPYPASGPMYSARYSTATYPKDSHSLKVVSFNAAYARTPEKIIHDFMQIPEIRDAEIILLQEVTGETTGTSNAPDVIAKALGLNYVFSPGMIFDRLDYGNAILSKYPLSNFKKVILAFNQSSVDKVTRTALMATVNLNGQKVQAASVHLSVLFGDSFGRDFLRSEQLKSGLKQFEVERLSTVLVGGDLNTFRAKGEKHIQALMKAHDFSDIHPNSGWTFRPMRTHLDHLFWKGKVKVLESGNARESTSSDHIPIWSRIEISIAR
jgi:endonuclease/exonuclease/phosphatase family metal-dependent hydrolase